MFDYNAISLNGKLQVVLSYTIQGMIFSRKVDVNALYYKKSERVFRGDDISILKMLIRIDGNSSKPACTHTRTSSRAFSRAFSDFLVIGRSSNELAYDREYFLRLTCWR